MKYNTVISMGIVFMLLVITDKSYSQKNQFKSVKIEYQDFLTESIDYIDCNSFEAAFKNTIRSKIFNDSSSLVKFSVLAKNFKRKRHELDVRGVITFNCERGEKRYCFDPYGYFEINGVSYYNKKLLNYIAAKLHLWH